jgi:Regulator of microtubule dynamics protein 1-3
VKEVGSGLMMRFVGLFFFFAGCYFHLLSHIFFAPVHLHISAILCVEFNGIKAQLQNSPTIRDHFEKAIELNPKDATSHHLLGLWCFTFADMPVGRVYVRMPFCAVYEHAS